MMVNTRWRPLTPVKMIPDTCWEQTQQSIQEQTHIAQDLVPSPRHTDTTFNIQHSTVQISEITTFSLFIAFMNNRENFLQSNCQWFIKIYNKCFDAYHQLKATCVFFKEDYHLRSMYNEGRLDKIFAESKISDTYVLLFNFIQTEYFNNCLNELPVGIWQRDSHRAQCELVILHEYWEDVLWAVSSSFALSMLNIYEGMLPIILDQENQFHLVLISCNNLIKDLELKKIDKEECCAWSKVSCPTFI